MYTVQGLGAAWGRGGGQTGVVGNTAFAASVNSLQPAPLSKLHRRDRALVRPESLSLCVPTSLGAAPPKALLLGLKLGWCSRLLLPEQRDEWTDTRTLP